MLKIVVVAMVVFFALSGLLVIALKQSGKSSWSVAAKPIMSGIEFRLYKLLTLALPECHVVCQVGMMAIIQMKGDSKIIASFKGRIDRMILDFVVLDANGTVVAIIELDDKTHDREKQKARDANKNAALLSAGYKLMRWKTHKEPTVQQIRTLFCEDLNDSNKHIFDQFGPIKA